MAFLVIRPNQQDSQFYLLLDAFFDLFPSPTSYGNCSKEMKFDWEKKDKSGRGWGGEKCEIKWQAKL